VRAKSGDYYVFTLVYQYVGFDWQSLFHRLLLEKLDGNPKFPTLS
jgi:hypothetical protein